MASSTEFRSAEALMEALEGKGWEVTPSLLRINLPCGGQSVPAHGAEFRVERGKVDKNSTVQFCSTCGSKIDFKLLARQAQKEYRQAVNEVADALEESVLWRYRE